jgi:transposase-like protein
MTPEQVRHAKALLTQPDATVASIARLLNVSRSTLSLWNKSRPRHRHRHREPNGRQD